MIINIFGLFQSIEDFDKLKISKMSEAISKTQRIFFKYVFSFRVLHFIISRKFVKLRIVKSRMRMYKKGIKTSYAFYL